MDNRQTDSQKDKQQTGSIFSQGSLQFLETTRQAQVLEIPRDLIQITLFTRLTDPSTPYTQTLHN